MKPMPIIQDAPLTEPFSSELIPMTRKKMSGAEENLVSFQVEWDGGEGEAPFGRLDIYLTSGGRSKVKTIDFDLSEPSNLDDALLIYFRAGAEFMRLVYTPLGATAGEWSFTVNYN